MAREYKDSGVAWAEQIPSDWKVIRGKNLLKLMNRPVRETDDVVTCFRDGEVILRSERRTEGFTMSDKEIGYQGINKGDIVIHGMDGFAGSMGVSKSTGKGSPVLVVCNPKDDDDSRYIIYYLRALAMNNVFIALATGIRERSCDLRWNKISELPFIQPKASEQKLIADYLDEKCGEIDKLVSLQEQMIEELKAYKQSVITEAVTKGLNPDAPMKDSGIDWIGYVPAEWVETKIKFHGTIRSGDGISIEEIKEDGKYPVWGGNGLMGYTDKFNESDNSIIIGRVGALCGNVRVLERPTFVSDNALILRLLNDVHVGFMYWLLIGANLNRLNTSNAQPLITGTKVKNIKIALPSIDEQRSIASYLDSKCADIDSLIALKRQKIESLKEYKKSIIFEYVTGKKQVV